MLRALKIATYKNTIVLMFILYLEHFLYEERNALCATCLKVLNSSPILLSCSYVEILIKIPVHMQILTKPDAAEKFLPI